MERPRLRPLEVYPVDAEDGRLIVLRDPSGFEEQPIGVRPEAYVLLTLMNGARTLTDIQAEFSRLTQHVVPLADLEQMVTSLEQRHLLDSESFHRYKSGIEAEFLAAPVRKAVHADQVYPSDPASLTRVLDGYFTNHPAPRLEIARVTALIAPHIDYGRGWRGFAAAYAGLATLPPPDTVVLLGTAHYAEDGRFILCAKGFATPYGTLALDAEMASSLTRRYPELSRGVVAHRHEHSLEFQTVFLQHRWGEQAPKIVPILCTTLDDLVQAGQDPSAVPEVRDFVDALAESAHESGKSVLFLAGADLSHVGRQFGDQQSGGELKEQVAAADRRVLDAVCRADASALFATVAELKNVYRICSVASLYTTLSVAGAERGQLLHYEQAIDPGGASLVSFASVVLGS